MLLLLPPVSSLAPSLPEDMLLLGRQGSGDAAPFGSREMAR